MAMRSKIRDSTNKVRRYWPGKAPQWADDHDTSFSDEDGDITILSRDISFPTRDDDPRPSSLALAEMRISNHDDDHRRHIRSAEIFDTTEEEEEAMDERRRRIKERVLRQREQEEEDVYKTDDDELEDESDEEYFSEEEEEEDEHLAGEVVMVKPVFVSKSTRDTIVERQGLEKAEELALEARRRMEERKRETKMMLLEEIRKEKEGLMNQDSAGDDIDTDDDAEDKKAWEARESARVKKERAAMKKKEEFERVKKMSNKERREYWERKYPLPAVPRPRKRKLKFMGAFFRPDSDDEDGILRRTGEDKMDKTTLPKVKNFGRKGRTKSSNLVNEDTTDGNNPWMGNDSRRSRQACMHL